MSIVSLGLGRRVGSNLTVFLLTLIWVLPCLGKAPVKAESQIESLAGIHSVHVLVDIGLSKKGPTRKILQEEVERQLHESSIQVIPYGEGVVTPSVPTFHVEVAVWKNAENTYVYFVNANVYQAVHLVRNEQILTQASTWQSKVIGLGMLDHIQKDVAKVSKKFILNVQRANKQKSNIQ